jgi:hypothetical protein
MTNIVKEWDLNPICKDKFHWTAFDKNKKKRYNDGLLTKPKLVTCKTCVCVSVTLCFLVWHLNKTQRGWITWRLCFSVRTTFVYNDTKYSVPSWRYNRIWISIYIYMFVCMCNVPNFCAMRLSGGNSWSQIWVLIWIKSFFHIHTNRQFESRGLWWEDSVTVGMGVWTWYRLVWLKICFGGKLLWTR